MSNLTDLTTPQVQKIAGPLGGLLIKVDIKQVEVTICCFNASGFVTYGEEEDNLQKYKKKVQKTIMDFLCNISALTRSTLTSPSPPFPTPPLIQQ